MKKEAEHWLSLAKEDYEDGLYLFKGGRYPNAFYHLCLAIEKVLKGACIENLNQPAKHTHNLETLGRKSGLDLSEDQYRLLEELFKHFQRIRYRDIAEVYYNTKAKTEPIAKQAQEMYLWILKTFEKH